MKTEDPGKQEREFPDTHFEIRKILADISTEYFSHHKDLANVARTLFQGVESSDNTSPHSSPV